MRSLPLIESVWNSGGPFIGNRKPVTRVTVQEPWSDIEDDLVIRTTDRVGVGARRHRGVPLRWFQRQDNSQVERELPNVLNVSIDRSMQQDAGSFNITLANQWMYDNGEAPNHNRLGRPGYFTPTHGDSMEAQARWNHVKNEWNNILVPNALIRVYTGFGGDKGEIRDAVANGNLALYGIFLIDEVRISTNGQITISGRDMAKLLIEQQLFPPLVPAEKYPLRYDRWNYRNAKVRAAKQAVPIQRPANIPAGDKRTVYRDSAVDHWYGRNASIYGHRGSHSTDGNPASYALSVGNSHPSRPFCTDWWEYDCGEQINGVYLHPWAGGYVLYISVMENGAWQHHPSPPVDDGGVIPYDASHLFATQNPAVDHGADIPYVAKFLVPHEESREFVLPRVFQAERVRVTFRNHYYSGLGTWKYRCGIREVRLRGVSTSDPQFQGSRSESVGGEETVTVDPFIQAGGSIRNPDKLYSQGYVTASNFTQVDAFGDARRRLQNNDREVGHPTALALTPDGKGYYMMDMNGNIGTFGDAEWFGDPADDGFVPDPFSSEYPWDMALTDTGKGYWVLSTTGTVWCYGDATDFNPKVEVNDPVLCSSIAANPVGHGYWILRNDGRVFNFGDAGDFGQYNDIKVYNGEGEGLMIWVNCSVRAQSIRPMSNGKGFWVLLSNGAIRQHGTAVKWGEPEYVDHSRNIFAESFWEIFPAPDDKGYLLLHGSGRVYAFGSVQNFGGPVPGGEARVRSDGNYLDYSDIARDLALWSGFLFFDEDQPRAEPGPVYGSIESTGAFADELPEDIFDKRPVIDALTTIREVTGYLCWVDSEGRFRYESPNWWHIGNFNELGQHVEKLIEIDEKVQLTDYTLSTSDDPLRSTIIISSHDPYADYSGTVTYAHTPNSKKRLRGLVKPAMWINEFFTDPEEQQLTAELIGLHIAFQERIGQLTCVANPAIDVNDQVRIFEEQTGESYVHYVQGVNFSHDLKSGQYRMTLTTHWLAAGTDTGDVIGGETFPVSRSLRRRMEAQQFGKFSKDEGGRL